MAGEISEKMKMVHFQQPEMITRKIATAQSPEVTDCLLGKSQSPCIVAMKAYRDQKRERENSILGCQEHKGPPGPLASPTTKTRLKSVLHAPDQCAARRRKPLFQEQGAAPAPFPAEFRQTPRSPAPRDASRDSETGSETSQMLSQVFINNTELLIALYIFEHFTNIN